MHANIYYITFLQTLMNTVQNNLWGNLTNTNEKSNQILDHQLHYKMGRPPNENAQFHSVIILIYWDILIQD